MNNGNCGNNICGLGNNSILWIIIILLFMPNLFGGCGSCNNGSDLLILIVLVCFLMGGNNGLFGIGCGC